MAKKNSAKSKIQQVVDYLKASGDQRPGAVIQHFKEKGRKVDYGEVRTAKQRAWPEKYAKKTIGRPRTVGVAPTVSTNGRDVAAVIAAAELVEKVGGVAAARIALAAVEKIRRLPA